MKNLGYIWTIWKINNKDNYQKKLDYDDFVVLLNGHLSDTDAGISPNENISFEATKKVVEDIGYIMTDI